ncbi:hypothetical protein VTN77DRAFT_2565 [Rasamsonia byssochlamydoides]|uniref:uncharacterized protein n=1 Tax=Rasamsonia byssochlamydoides TaxID=89139 RepID=UPI0037422C5C
MVTRNEVAKHASRASCWVILYGRVYDITEFLDSHPGGADVILRLAGQDATEEYDLVHSPALLEQTLPESSCLGPVEDSASSSSESSESSPNSVAKPAKTPDEPPPLHTLINLDDFERVAQRYLPPNAWAYYRSGADDEITKRLNRQAYQRVLLRSRVMRNVERVDTSTTILGHRSSMPLFVCPAALAKLAHRRGECAIAAAAGAEGLIQVISNSSSMPVEEIIQARTRDDQTFFFQLYVNTDVEKSKTLLRKVERLGVKAIWVTVDSPVMGKREADERMKARIQSSEQSGVLKEGQQVQGIARTLSRMLSARVTWDDLGWIRETTSLPIVIKGIQSVEDAVLAYENGAQGIVLSNHGGRSQDTTQPPLLTLLEIRKFAPFLLGRMEIYLDGGIRRGTDIVKALALGATAVGMGRPFLYSLSAGYGEAGVRRMIGVVRQELETNMALVGATRVSEIVPQMVNAKPLERDLVDGVKL